MAFAMIACGSHYYEQSAADAAIYHFVIANEVKQSSPSKKPAQPTKQSSLSKNPAQPTTPWAAAPLRGSQ